MTHHSALTPIIVPPAACYTAERLVPLRRCPAASRRRQVNGGCGSLVPCCTLHQLPAKACWWRCSLQGCRGLLQPSCAWRAGERACHRLLPSVQHHRHAGNALGGCRAGHGHLLLHAGHVLAPTANRGAVHSPDAVPPPSQSPCRRTRAPGSGPPLLRAPLAQPSRPVRLGLWEHQPGDQA